MRMNAPDNDTAREAKDRLTGRSDIPPYSEDDLLPISALQHFAFCERQCALIHVEGAWVENRLTTEGRIMHERVHDSHGETRHGVRIVRGLRLRSFRLGLTGIADVVEFSRSEDGKALVFPVEYKRGKPKRDSCDEIQLCAQAICLEEMLGVTVPDGALFYGINRRRHPVTFNQDLRAATAEAARRVHALIESGRTPPAVYAPKCDHCSLFVWCLPKTAACRKSVKAYLSVAL